jgi:hypothetical protein
MKSMCFALLSFIEFISSKLDEKTEIDFASLRLPQLIHFENEKHVLCTAFFYRIYFKQA